MVHGFERSTVHSIRDLDLPIRHYVTFYEQPLLPWLIAHVYHWYDMRVYRLPGFKLLERALKRLQGGGEWYVPLSARQDIRCYHLSRRKRTDLVTVEVAQEQYEKMKGR